MAALGTMPTGFKEVTFQHYRITVVFAELFNTFGRNLKL